MAERFEQIANKLLEREKIELKRLGNRVTYGPENDLRLMDDIYRRTVDPSNPIDSRNLNKLKPLVSPNNPINARNVNRLKPIVSQNNPIDSRNLNKLRPVVRPGGMTIPIKRKEVPMRYYSPDSYTQLYGPIKPSSYDRLRPINRRIEDLPNPSGGMNAPVNMTGVKAPIGYSAPKIMEKPPQYFRAPKQNKKFYEPLVSPKRPMYSGITVGTNRGRI